MAGRMSGVPWHVGYLARETFENRLEEGYIDEHHKNNKTDEYDFGKHNKFEKRKNNNKKSIASEKNKKQIRSLRRKDKNLKNVRIINMLEIKEGFLRSMETRLYCIVWKTKKESI